ncbi:hypothetical protein CBOM_08107 [Ceraceosorus bombacis]|uniref:Uncharacterized protein n=1 Tax=Ceraceosorus bombacis TaxID=401625 RepID=A0A0P1BAE3_9BASI|nr:hypothetical protein CBOM_08107 [Ceraceosorus bombacis]
MLRRCGRHPIRFSPTLRRGVITQGGPLRRLRPSFHNECRNCITFADCTSSEETSNESFVDLRGFACRLGPEAVNVRAAATHDDARQCHLITRRAHHAMSTGDPVEYGIHTVVECLIETPAILAVPHNRSSLSGIASPVPVICGACQPCTPRNPAVRGALKSAHEACRAEASQVQRASCSLSHIFANVTDVGHARWHKF